MRHEDPRRRPTGRLLAFVLALVALGPAAVRAESTPPVEQKPDSFETRAHGAVKTQDVGTLLAPFIDSCGGTRCAEARSARAALDHDLSAEELPATDLPRRDERSGGDRGLGLRRRRQGHHLSAGGDCIACSEPMPIGSHREPRFVTLATPDKSAATLAAGVPVSKSTVAFDDFAAAKHWAEMEKPFLRAEFLFQPRRPKAPRLHRRNERPGSRSSWWARASTNRCTGEIWSRSRHRRDSPIARRLATRTPPAAARASRSR